MHSESRKFHYKRCLETCQVLSLVFTSSLLRNARHTRYWEPNSCPAGQAQWTNIVRGGFHNTAGTDRRCSKRFVFSVQKVSSLEADFDIAIRRLCPYSTSVSPYGFCKQISLCLPSALVPYKELTHVRAWGKSFGSTAMVGMPRSLVS